MSTIANVAGFSSVPEKHMPWVCEYEARLFQDRVAQRPRHPERHDFGGVHGQASRRVEARLNILLKQINAAIVSEVSDIHKQDAPRRVAAWQTPSACRQVEEGEARGPSPFILRPEQQNPFYGISLCRYQNLPAPGGVCWHCSGRPHSRASLKCASLQLLLTHHLPSAPLCLHHRGWFPSPYTLS